MKTKENLEKPWYRCYKCVFESQDQLSFKLHVTEENHQGKLEKKEALCPYCDCKRQSLCKIKLHIDFVHQYHSEKKYFCDVCSKGFIFEFSYKMHDHIRDKKEPTRWCEICDLKVMCMTTHVVEKHELNGQKICPYCDYKDNKLDKKLNLLKYHIESKHSEHSDKKFDCKVCFKKFMFKTLFQSHLRTHTTTQKKHICELCGQEYTAAKTLKEHMLRIHPVSDAKDFICDDCAFSTYSMSKLKRHKFVKHEVEKHKPCPHCEFKTPDSNSLDVHIDRRHPEHGEKQFFCETCGKGFIFKASLADHPLYYCPNNPKFKGRSKKSV